MKTYSTVLLMLFLDLVYAAENPRVLILDLWHLNGMVEKTGLIDPVKNTYVNESNFEGENDCKLVSITYVYDELGDEIENINTSTIDFSKSIVERTHTTKGWFGGLVRSHKSAMTVHIKFPQKVVHFVIESDKYPNVAGERYNDYFLFFANDENHASRIEEAVMKLGKECNPTNTP